jgi:hypothetical protein
MNELAPAASYVNDAEPDASIDISPKHRVVSGGIRVFYAHDDSYGPFNRVVVPLSGEQPTGSGEGASRAAPDKKAAPVLKLGRPEPRQEYEIRHIVVPLPLDVRTSLDSSFRTAVRLFDKTGYVETDVACFVLWRSLLLRGTDFKSSLGPREYSAELKGRYGTLHLPQYVWLHEVSIISGDRVDRNAGLTIDGEFLLDATAPKHDALVLSERYFDRFHDHMQADGEFARLKNDNIVPAFDWKYVTTEHQNNERISTIGGAFR